MFGMNLRDSLRVCSMWTVYDIYLWCSVAKGEEQYCQSGMDEETRSTGHWIQAEMVRITRY